MSGNTLHVAIAWFGLPYYAANVIGRMVRAHPEWKVTVISSRDSIPYTGIDETVKVPIHWVNADQELKWSQIGVGYPDVFVLTSWCHPAFMTLAQEAKFQRGATIVSMVDNYFHGGVKQWLGAVYFRLKLRRLFDYMWVPGRRSAKFMRFLGMPAKRILTGLYAADPEMFYPPQVDSLRSNVIFVGQFIPRKGVGEIVSALQRRGQGGAQVRLIGQGALEARLRATGAVVTGFKQPAELAEIYRQAGALLLPSVLDHWGVVAHEAASSGCLILATRQCGCVDDLVEHGRNGYVMAASSADEILKALAWHEALSPAAIQEGRLLSVRKAAEISPARWVKTMEKLIESASL